MNTEAAQERTFIHASDLHLHAASFRDGPVIAALARAVARVGPTHGVLLTGDVFDSANLDRTLAAIALQDLVESLRAAASSAVPVVLVPGNHDRRDSGVIGPDNPTLFRALAQEAPPGVTVLGIPPFALATVLPSAALPGFPGTLVGYDSTCLPTGRFSAGGSIQAQDLLQVAGEIEHRRADPVVVMLHHHLVPTPVTDVGAIDVSGKPAPVRWFVREVLPRLVAYADREELTMTAFGSGTALSALHGFGRPVLVLHGHKHYPAARLLKRTRAEEGDVLLLSAGSAGVSERWSPTDLPEGMRLWPSFNCLRFTGCCLRADTVFFSPAEKPDESASIVKRPLVSASWAGADWHVEPTPRSAYEFEEWLQWNRATYTLKPNESDPEGPLDLECIRDLRSDELESYDEVLEGLPGSKVVMRKNGKRIEQRLPAAVELAPRGTTRYCLRGAVSASLRQLQQAYGALTTCEWVGLVNRYGAAEARLAVTGLPAGGQRAFGSLTDLTTGREVPARLIRGGVEVVLEVRPCPPRTLLRVYWPLVEPRCQPAVERSA